LNKRARCLHSGNTFDQKLIIHGQATYLAFQTIDFSFPAIPRLGFQTRLTSCKEFIAPLGFVA